MSSWRSIADIIPPWKGAQNHLQTTWVWIEVSCPVEQPLRCDLLKLILSIRGICPLLWTGEFCGTLDGPALGRPVRDFSHWYTCGCWDVAQVTLPKQKKNHVHSAGKLIRKLCRFRHPLVGLTLKRARRIAPLAARELVNKKNGPVCWEVNEKTCWFNSELPGNLSIKKWSSLLGSWWTNF